MTSFKQWWESQMGFDHKCHQRDMAEKAWAFQQERITKLEADKRDDYDMIMSLKERIAELEAENKRLKSRHVINASIEKGQKQAQEKVAMCMLGLGLATGHGDTIDDLLSEFAAQVRELQDTNRRESDEYG